MPKLPLKLPITSSNVFIEPSALVMDIPSSSIYCLDSLVGAASLEIIALKLVPAWPATIPLFAMTPRAVATSSMEYPAAPATGATYLKDSPRDWTSVLDALEAIAKTSAKCAASLAARPNPVRELVTMDDASARAIPSLAARFMTPSMPCNMASVFQPA